MTLRSEVVKKIQATVEGRVRPIICHPLANLGVAASVSFQATLIDLVR